MIKEYAASLAEQMGIKLTRITVVDGKLLGCRDSHLLQLYSDNQMESALVYQREIETLQNGISRDRLESRIRSALLRLQSMLDPEALAMSGKD